MFYLRRKLAGRVVDLGGSPMKRSEDFYSFLGMWAVTQGYVHVWLGKFKDARAWLALGTANASDPAEPSSAGSKP
jgi:hypothetical protein